MGDPFYLHEQFNIEFQVCAYMRLYNEAYRPNRSDAMMDYCVLLHYSVNVLIQVCFTVGLHRYSKLYLCEKAGC